MPIDKEVFSVFAKHVDVRFDDMAELIKENRHHKHPDRVAWVALVPILGGLVGMIIGLS